MLIRKDTHTPMFIAALFTIAKTWKQPKCPSTDDCIKIWCIYTHIQWTISHKKEILPYAAVWMALENIMLSDINKLDRDKYCTMSLICGI